MASLRVIFSAFLVVAIMANISFATDYIVGDSAGWTVGFDYQAWAKGKLFQVGDTLVFQYPSGVHNVFRVNGTNFRTCEVPAQGKALTSGNDTIVLGSPGRKWYICGVTGHCDAGQKLAIIVQPIGGAPEISPSPTPVASPPFPSLAASSPSPSPAPAASPY